MRFYYIFFSFFFIFSISTAYAKCAFEYDFHIPAEKLSSISQMCNKLVINSASQSSSINVLLTKEVEVPNAFAFFHKKSKIILVSKSFLEIHYFDPHLLAFVFGHELGHFQLGHVKNETTLSNIFDSFKSGALASFGSESNLISSGLKFSINSYEAKYSQSQEIAADNYSYKLLLNSGYSKNDVLNSLAILNRNSSSSSWTRFFSTHPSTQKRIENIHSK